MAVETSVSKVLRARRASHGDYARTCAVAQAMRHAVVLSGRARLTPAQAEAVTMIITKLARIVAGNADHSDHWFDIEGYARLARISITAPGEVPNV